MKHYTLGTAEISPGVGGKWAGVLSDDVKLLTNLH